MTEHTATNNTTRAATAAESAVILAREALIGRLISGLTHEISNPLTCITNALFLLGAGSGSTRDNARMLQVIEKEVGRIRGIIDAMRQYTSHAPLAERVYTLGELVEELQVVLAARLRKGAVRLECARNAAQTALPPASRELKLALLPLLILAADRSTHDDTLTLDGRNDGKHFVVSLRVPSAALTQHEARYLASESTPPADQDWLGIASGLRLARELVARRQGVFEVAASPGKQTLITLQIASDAKQLQNLDPEG